MFEVVLSIIKWARNAYTIHVLVFLWVPAKNLIVKRSNRSSHFTYAGVGTFGLQGNKKDALARHRR